MLDPQECPKLQLNQSPIPRNRPWGSLGLCLVAAVAHPASRCLPACLPDALVCTDSHETDYQIVRTQRVGFCIFFFQPLFLRGEFFKPKPLLVVIVVIAFKMFC